MRQRTLAALFLGLLAVISARAQAPAPDSSLGGILAADASRAGEDIARVATAPLHSSAREWAVAAGVAGGTAALLLLDRTARSVARRNHSDAADGVFHAGWMYGREITALSLAGGIYAGGLVFGSRHVRTTGRMLLESAAIAGVAGAALKALAGRSRPGAGEGPYRFRGFQTSLEHTSLPSGHSTIAFSLSSVLARRIGNSYAAVGLYGLAGVTALSRVYHDDHWLSDAALGAAIGTAVGLAVSAGDAEDGSGVVLAPSLRGMSASYRF